MFYEQTMCRLSRSPDIQDCPDFQKLQVWSDISDFPYVQTLQFLNSKGTDSMTNDQYAITNSQWSMTKWHNLISNLISNLIPIWAWLQRSPFLYDFNFKYVRSFVPYYSVVFYAIGKRFSTVTICYEYFVAAVSTVSRQHMQHWLCPEMFSDAK